jgi:LysM repeat protein
MFVRIGIVAVVAALLWSVVAAGSDGAGAPRAYVVKPYDTLWSIAVAHYAGDPRDGVWKLREHNGLDGTLIRPGQRLLVPP